MGQVPQLNLTEAMMRPFQQASAASTETLYGPLFYLNSPVLSRILDHPHFDAEYEMATSDPEGTGKVSPLAFVFLQPLFTLPSFFFFFFWATSCRPVTKCEIIIFLRLLLPISVMTGGTTPRLCSNWLTIADCEVRNAIAVWSCFFFFVLLFQVSLLYLFSVDISFYLFFWETFRYSSDAVTEKCLPQSRTERRPD